MNSATAATMKSSEECGGAWTAEEVDDEPDWFKEAGAVMDGNERPVASAEEGYS